MQIDNFICKCLIELLILVKSEKTYFGLIDLFKRRPVRAELLYLILSPHNRRPHPTTAGPIYHNRRLQLFSPSHNRRPLSVETLKVKIGWPMPLPREFLTNTVRNKLPFLIEHPPQHFFAGHNIPRNNLMKKRTTSTVTALTRALAPSTAYSTTCNSTSRLCIALGVGKQVAPGSQATVSIYC